MQKIIREQAEFFGFEITDWDIEQIKKRYFHVLVAAARTCRSRASRDLRASPSRDNIKSIRSVIKKYFAAHAGACRRASHGDLPKAND